MQAWRSLRASMIEPWTEARFAASSMSVCMMLFAGAFLPPPAAAQPAAAPAPASTGPVISPQAQAALSHLLQIPAAAAAPAAAAGVPGPMAPAAPQVQTGGRLQVVVRPGETLDRVIQRTLRDSPYRTELLRDAFVRLNRGAFPRGTPHWVQAGSVLQVPSPADLMLQVDPRWWPAPVHDAPATAAAAPSERRNWVRYP
jgi:Tfp pilus assembly protein FimV